MAKQNGSRDDGIILDDDGSPVEIDGVGVIDPASVGVRTGTDADGNPVRLNKDGTPRKRRGRAPGAATKKATLDLGGIDKILLSMHAMMASLLQTPELMIAPDEAKMLADGVNNVARHYDIIADEKTAAWVNLAMVCGAVYGPRVFVLWTKKKDAPKTPPNVTSLFGG